MGRPELTSVCTHIHKYTPSSAAELVNTICGVCLFLSQIECSSIEIRLTETVFLNKGCTAGKTTLQTCVCVGATERTIIASNIELRLFPIKMTVVKVICYTNAG